MKKNIFLFLLAFITLFNITSAQVANQLQEPMNLDTLETQTFSKVAVKIDSSKGAQMVSRAIINPPPTAATPDRVVYWVHGLGGTQVSMENAAIATENIPITPIPNFSPRKIKSIIPIGSTNIATGNKNTSYTDASMNNAAITLSQNMASSRTIDVPLSARNSANDFIISHSQGGIVSRTYDYRKNNNLDAIARQVSGIVTFGSPHKGAKILNNTPVILSFAANGAQKLAAGPKAEFDESLAGQLLDLFWKGGTDKIDTVIKNVTNTIANKVLPLLFKDNTAPISTDYQDGAPFLNTLKANDLVSNTHKAAFYGLETEPVIWRTFYNFLNKKPEEFATFNADFDQELVDNMNQNAATYLSKYAYNNAVADFHLSNYYSANWWNFMTSYCSNNCSDLVLCGNAAYCLYEKHKRVSAAYNIGVQWFANANDEWKSIIGALEVGPVQDGCTASSDYTVWECDPNAPQYCGWVTYTNQFFQGSGVINCSQFNTPTETYIPNTSIVKTYKDSDGTVTVESASAYPGLQWPARKMQGSNHLQMRNDGNMRTSLNELFNGITNSLTGLPEIDPWFITNKR